jgi:2'-5' RNA ligase
MDFRSAETAETGAVSAVPAAEDEPDAPPGGPVWRLFLGLPVTATRHLQELASDLQQLVPRGQVVPESRWHITLHFLGDVSPQDVSRLRDALNPLLNRVQFPNPMAWRGVGGFPTRQRPSVVWIGLKPSDDVQQLAQVTAGPLAGLGFTIDRRPFRPHLTLMRLKARPSRELVAWVHCQAEVAGGPAAFHEVVLYRSHLDRHGAVYEPVHVWPINHAPADRSPE